MGELRSFTRLQCPWWSSARRADLSPNPHCLELSFTCQVPRSLPSSAARRNPAPREDIRCARPHLLLIVTTDFTSFSFLRETRSCLSPQHFKLILSVVVQNGSVRLSRRQRARRRLSPHMRNRCPPPFELRLRRTRSSKLQRWQCLERNELVSARS